MIDVPERVREALRDGRYKKNYVVEVVGKDSIDEMPNINVPLNSSDSDKFAVTKTGCYKVYINKANANSYTHLKWYSPPNINGYINNYNLSPQYNRQEDDSNIIFTIFAMAGSQIQVEAIAYTYGEEVNIRLYYVNAYKTFPSIHTGVNMGRYTPRGVSDEFIVPDDAYYFFYCTDNKTFEDDRYFTLQRYMTSGGDFWWENPVSKFMSQEHQSISILDYSYMPNPRRVFRGDIIRFTASTEREVAIYAYYDNIRTYNIENDNLIKESVSLDERMATGDKMKFGLCEGSAVEFQYFDKPNIRGERIRLKVQVQYKDIDNQIKWHDITLGFFEVKECPKQASTGIYKATAYNKLKSEYLNGNAKSYLMEYYDNDMNVSVYDIQRLLLDRYQIKRDFSAIIPHYVDPGWGITQTWIEVTANVKLYLAGAFTDGHSPFSPYEIAKQVPSFTGYGYPWFAYHSFSFNVDRDDYDYYQFNFLKGNLVQMENTICNQISEIFGNAYFGKNDHPWGEQGYYTGEEIIKALCEQDVYRKLCGATYNGLYYSTIQYKYETKYNLQHRCAGTLSDLIYHLQPFVCSPHVGYDDFLSTVEFYFVSAFGLIDNLTPASATKFFYKYIDGFDHSPYTQSQFLRTYEYYDSMTSEVKQDAIPHIYYSNGDIYDDTSNNAGQEAFSVYCLNVTDLLRAELITIDISAVQDFSLRDIMTGLYETQCQYGKLDRETDLFSGVELNNSRLLPADNLYPSESLYPNGNSEHPMASQYSKLWTDSAGVQKFRYLIITYKALEGEQGQEQEVDKTLQRTVNHDGNVDYNMSDNWLFRNLIWTEEDIAEYAEAMVEKMQNIKWFPFEMWCAGLPYLEAGDEIEITTDDGTYTSYVLNRQLNGIHNLEDNLINGTLDIF